MNPYFPITYGFSDENSFRITILFPSACDRPRQRRRLSRGTVISGGGDDETGTVTGLVSLVVLSAASKDEVGIYLFDAIVQALSAEAPDPQNLPQCLESPLYQIRIWIMGPRRTEFEGIMKKVVVTGAKGGTGRSIVRVLSEAGYEVLGVDLKPCGFYESGYRQLDVADGSGLHSVFAEAYAVVHFGSLPTDSWTSWETTYRNLSLGGYHVLQAAADLRIPRVVMASSPQIYGDYRNAPYLPIDEDTPAQPPSIYGAVKHTLEVLAQHYVRWQGLAIAALRPQRIVYEDSYEWRFRRFTGDDRAAVDVLWSYVDARDVATACLAWVDSDRTGFEDFNVAADDVCVTTSTLTLLEKFYPHIRDIRSELPDRTGLVDCSKLKRMLGWKPQHDWQTMAAESESGHPKETPA